MDSFLKINYLVILSLIPIVWKLTYASGQSTTANLLVAPTGPVLALTGSTISFNCTINKASKKPVLKWLIPGVYSKDSSTKYSGSYRYSQDWKAPNILVLTIQSVQHDDAGTFICRSKDYGSQSISLFVRDPPGKKVEKCATTQFRCPDGVCIFTRYLCDNVADCSDKTDEIGCDLTCADDQFRCDNGQCINKEYRCDSFRSHDCRDGSDEKDCEGRYKYGDELDDDETQRTPHQEPHGWHFNAIYSGVASIIGVACVGAIIVITMCRIHMRRQAVRRSSRYRTYLESRGVDVRNNAHRPYPWLRRTPHEHQHHLNRSPDSHLSNDLENNLDILPRRCPGQTRLNVNIINLRFSPEGEPEFTHNITKPPSYSELENLDPPPRGESPPPPYSTLPATPVDYVENEAVPPYQPITSTVQSNNTEAPAECSNNTNNINTHNHQGEGQNGLLSQPSYVTHDSSSQNHSHDDCEHTELHPAQPTHDIQSSSVNHLDVSECTGLLTESPQPAAINDNTSAQNTAAATQRY